MDPRMPGHEWHAAHSKRQGSKKRARAKLFEPPSTAQPAPTPRRPIGSAHEDFLAGLGRRLYTAMAVSDDHDLQLNAGNTDEREVVNEPERTQRDIETYVWTATTRKEEPLDSFWSAKQLCATIEGLLTVRSTTIDKTLELTVGNDETTIKTFTVQVRRLRETTSFFDLAASADSSEYIREVDSRSYEIASDHPHCWAIFVYWLYHETIHSEATMPVSQISQYTDAAIEALEVSLDDLCTFYPEPPTKYSDGWDFWTSLMHLLHAYMLGERLACVEFKNAILNQIILYFRERDEYAVPYPLEIRYAFFHTAPDSKLRRLLVDLMFYRASDERMRMNFCSAQHHEFHLDIGNKHYEEGNASDRRRQPNAFTSDLDRIRLLYHERPTSTGKRSTGDVRDGKRPVRNKADDDTPASSSC